MTYKITKNDDGRVDFKMKTDNGDFVNSYCPYESALQIASEGKITQSSMEGFPICVDHKFYFPGEFTPTKKKAAEKKAAEKE